MTEPSTPEIGEINKNNSSHDILIQSMILYHGSGTPGIETFNAAEEDTIGSGIYFTSQKESAIGYSRRRARRPGSVAPILYAVEVSDVTLANLKDDKHVTHFLNGFKGVLQAMLPGPNSDWYSKQSLGNALSKIEKGEISARNLREITFPFGQSFTEYLKSLGYDGLVGREGGEGNDVGSHDSYVIFNPEKVNIVHEQVVK